MILKEDIVLKENKEQAKRSLLGQCLSNFDINKPFTVQITEDKIGYLDAIKLVEDTFYLREDGQVIIGGKIKSKSYCEKYIKNNYVKITCIVNEMNISKLSHSF